MRPFNLNGTLLVTHFKFNHSNFCIIGSPKKPRRDSPPPIGSTNGVGSMTMNGERTSDVIDTLMEMEARVNQEMSIRYRNTLVASNGATLDNSAASSSGLGDDPSVDLNEISRTTLLVHNICLKTLLTFSL